MRLVVGTRATPAYDVRMRESVSHSKPLVERQGPLVVGEGPEGAGGCQKVAGRCGSVDDDGADTVGCLSGLGNVELESVRTDEFRWGIW